MEASAENCEEERCHSMGDKTLCEGESPVTRLGACYSSTLVKLGKDGVSRTNYSVSKI